MNINHYFPKNVLPKSVLNYIEQEGWDINEETMSAYGHQYSIYYELNHKYGYYPPKSPFVMTGGKWKKFALFVGKETIDEMCNDYTEKEREEKLMDYYKEKIKEIKNSVEFKSFLIKERIE